MIALSLAFFALSIAFGLLLRKYHQTKNEAYFWAALAVMRAQVEVQKEQSRSRSRTVTGLRHPDHV